MTEAQGLSPGVDSGNTVQHQPQATESIIDSKPVERTFTQQQVDNIVRGVKQDTEEKFKRLRSTQPEYFQQKYGDDSYPVNNTQQFSEDNYRKIASEEAQKLHEKLLGDQRSILEREYAERTVKNFWDKVNSAKDRYQDFDTVVNKSQTILPNYPDVVQMLSESVENAGDVFHHLVNDETRMANLQILANADGGKYRHLAISELNKISKSIKDNDQAYRTKIPNEPLSQMRPSNTGMDNNGVPSVSDLRRKYRG